MPKIDLHAKFGTPSRVGAPILTQTVPAIPPGSNPGEVLFKNTVPALPRGSLPGTPIDIMVQVVADETTKILNNRRKK